MTLATLVLVLASAIIHATWNLWTKQIRSSARSAPLMWLLTTISSVVYAPVAIVMLATDPWRPPPLALALIAGSGVIHVVYFLLLLRGYRHGELSLVYPVARGTGPLLAAAGAIAWLGERPTPLSITGAGLIALGVLVLTLRGPAPADKPAGWTDDEPVLADPGCAAAPLSATAPAHAAAADFATAAGAATIAGTATKAPPAAQRARAAAGLRYGLATGVLIAVYTLWDGWSVKQGGIPPLVFYWGGELVRMALFTPGALADREGVASLWRDHRARVLGIAILSPLSYILILLAFSTGAVSHIAPAREVSIVIGAYLGGRVLGEGDRPRRLAAAVAFAAGVIALALA